MKILVLGDFIWDVYTFCEASRLCPEAPVPVLVPQSTRESAGGAGLVHEQLRELGADAHLRVRSTSRKHRYFAGNHLICRVDEDAKVEGYKSYLSPVVTPDLFVICDYGKGAINRDMAKAIVATNKPCFVDAKHHWPWYAGPKVTIFPNHHEAAPIKEGEIPAGNFQSYEYGCVVSKMGRDGARLNDKQHKDLHVPSVAGEIVDVCGAGDIFMASFVYAWTLQLPAEGCLLFANSMAGESCRHVGTHVVGKQVAQSFLDSLRASAKSGEQETHRAGGSSSQWPTPTPFYREFAKDVPLCTVPGEGDTPLGDCILDQAETAMDLRNSLDAQIRQKSPSDPTVWRDTRPPADLLNSGYGESHQAPLLHPNSIESGHQCEHTLEQDQESTPEKP